MFQTLISSVTVGAGGSTSMTFTSIPQTYTDLTLAVCARSLGGGANATLYLEFNADVSVFYNGRSFFGTGASVFSGTDTSLVQINLGRHSGSSSTANTFGSTNVLIPNYTGSANKTMSFDSVSENNASDAFQWFGAGRFPKTTAVTSLRLFDNGGGFAQHSTAYLYGTLKGSGGATVS